jgi:hypothetical protein
MSRKTSSAIDFATYVLEDAHSGPIGNTENAPLMNAQAHPVVRKTVDWQLTAEKISVGCSTICLLAAFIWRISAHDGNNLKVRVSRETLLFSNDTDVEDGMRLLHSTWNNHCEDTYPLLLQVPMWQETETGLVMHSSIYAFDIYIFFFGNCCVCILYSFPDMAMGAIR